MVEHKNRPAVQFLINTPVEVALRWVDGKLLAGGPYGDRMMYTTIDDRVMFLDCDVAAKINLLELQPGEPFMICKSRGSYKGASNVWKVWREKPGEPPTVAGESGLERDLRHSLAMKTNAAAVVVDHPAAARPTPHAPALAAKLDTHPPVNGSNGKTPPLKVPVNRAVIAAVRMVQNAMTETGEQWSDSARQDLVSTILIAAQREGWIAMWEATA